MTFTPDSPFPKAPANVIRAKDWNDVVAELRRLDGAKVERSGDAITGSLTVSGSVSVQSTDTDATLHVGGAQAAAGTPGTVDRIAVQPYGHTGGPWLFGARDDSNTAYLDVRYSGQLSTTFDSAGRVGINTPSPQNQLDVNGDVAISGKHAFRGSDPWLRLNQDGAFTAGTHTPSLFAPMALNVGGVSNWSSPGSGNAWVAGTLTTWGETRLGAGDQITYIGGNQTGVFMALHDDLWFADPQNGTIQIFNGPRNDWGTMVGHFNAPSSRAYKEDIKQLQEDDLDGLLDDAVRTDVVSFRYKGGKQTQVGVIAEEAPDYLVGVSGADLNLATYTGMVHGAVKALVRRVEELERRIAELEGTSAQPDSAASDATS